MSAARGQCGACKKDFCAKEANPQLCLTQCGHIFHKPCIFVADSTDKIKVLACPTCMSHKLRPVILIYQSLTDSEREYANPKQYEFMARSVPPIIRTGESGENAQMTDDDLLIHETLVSDFNDLLAKTLEQEKLCADTIASNAEMEREIAALKEKIEEQEKEMKRLLKRDSSGQQIGNRVVTVRVEPEYPNNILKPGESESEDEVMQGGLELDSDDELFADVEADDEEEVEEEEEAEDEDDLTNDPDFESPSSDIDEDDEDL